jgi:hypothetical protein
MSNLKQIGLAIAIYAGDNNEFYPMGFKTPNSKDNQPDSTYDGSWLSDIPNFTGNAIANNGASKQIFYCPGGSNSKDADSVNHWWFYKQAGTPDGDYKSTSYFVLIQRTYPLQTPKNFIPPNNPLRQRMMLTKATQPCVTNNVSLTASSTEVVTDFTMSTTTGANGSFFVPSTSTTDQPYLRNNGYLPNHTSGNASPVGNNTLCQDYHAEWRPFKQMTATGQPGVITWADDTKNTRVQWF